MVMVIASGVLAMTHIDFIIGSLLGFLTHHIAFALLGYDAIDKAFLALEVIAHFLRFVRSVAFLEHRQAGCHTEAIDYTASIHRTAVHIHGDDFGSQFNLLVIHLALAIQVCKTAFGKDNGVVGFVGYGSIKRLFLLSAHRIGHITADSERVYPDGIIYPHATVTCTLGFCIDTQHQKSCQHKERDDSM